MGGLKKKNRQKLIGK